MSKPYSDPTNGQWVGEYETRLPDGEVTRTTEWFPTEKAARLFTKTGVRPVGEDFDGQPIQDVPTGTVVWHEESQTWQATTDDPITTGQGVYLQLENGAQIMGKLDDLITFKP